MANSVVALNPEYWAAQIQRSLFKENSAVFLANTRFVNLVAGDGDTVNYASLSYPYTQTYTPGSDVTPTDLTASNEQLTIGTWLTQFTKVDDTEIRQAKYGIRETSVRRMRMGLSNRVEQAFLAEVTNASNSVDDGNIGGTAGNNAVVTTDNVPELFTAAGRKLGIRDATANGYAVIGWTTYGRLLQYRGARQTQLGDTVSVDGRAGKAFGWNIIVNNNLPFTAVLGMATDPSNNDTVTIAGVTFTFHTTLPATAGGLHATGTVDDTRANFAVALNAPQTSIVEAAATGYTKVSDENAWLLKEKLQISATNDNSADTLTITGYGDITLGETLTPPADVWTSARQDSLFTLQGAVDQVVQIPPFIEFSRDPDQFGTIVKALVGYGKKTFADGAREMVQVKINALGTAASNSHWL